MTKLSLRLQAMLWMLASGVLFILLNGLLRWLAQQMDPFVAGFLRYSAGVVVMLPFIWRAGLAAYRPHNVAGQFWRGALHTSGLLLWFWAVPHVPLAEITALGFTTPLFIMLGAMVFLGERVVAARWVAAAIGFCGVLVVVSPQLSGAGGIYNLVLLSSAPLFAASFLITKALTRRDAPHVIVVWQSLMVALFSLPFALWNWEWPTPAQWALFLLAGALGTSGHICLTRAFALADMSVVQPIRFLELVWASIFGFLVWGERPGEATFLGGAIIFASTTWIARREAKS
ncbi:DMT family transporter [Siccirubricoccus sp. KC 17139]|uniref:DMT family transporter n=1 Tax=Siccirubricoccus soli TaxID=2899147 RepID=A0ABT1D2V2_9PROT|nr:DMT family transporter [Siccirubricoccus soli]MCO6415937.1 DMT family transporter [Siccirubricoccus soli]MCP2682069.1 DMT family transporter [Siccirubricoccus soli]